MAEAIEILMNEAMKLERSEVLGARPHERTESRRGYANGFKPKRVNSRLGRLNLQVPQTRDVEFYPAALERGERSERALKLAVAEMYVQGVSTRKVQKITAELCGLDVSSMQVSRAAELLDEELTAWRERALGAVPYVILDARYEKVRHGGSVRDCAVLVAIGILEDGKRSVLGTSVSLSEAEVHWRTFLDSLIERGLHAVQLIVSDSHAGLKQARRACFPGAPWQRCQFHLMQNALHYVPKVSMRMARPIKNIPLVLTQIVDRTISLDHERWNASYYRNSATGSRCCARRNEQDGGGGCLWCRPKDGRSMGFELQRGRG
jgi:transposase-like protein